MANGKIRFGKQSGGQLTLVIPDGVTSTDLVLPESGTVASVSGAVTDNAIVRFDGTTGKVQTSNVTIDDNGNIGIGGETTTNGLIVGNLGGTNGHISLRRASDGIQVGNLTVDVTNSKIDLQSGYGTLSLSTSSTERMRIDSAGNVLLTSGTGALGYGTGSGGTVTQLTSKSTSVTLNKPSGEVLTHNAALAAGASVVFIINNSLAGTYDTSIAVTRNGNYDVKTTVTSSGVIYVKITNVSGSSLSESVPINFTVLKGANS